MTERRSDVVHVALDAAQSVREKSPEGHLRITRCVLSSASVCPYYGREIPGWEALGLQPGTIYQLYRDPTSLAQAATTMDGKPVLFQHKPVSAQDHPKEITVGAVGATHWEDPDLIGSFTVWDQEAIDAIEGGDLKAVSAGYAYRAIAQGGVHDGQPYSLTMVDIVFNHLALVAVPRVKNAIIGDQNTTTEAALATKNSARAKAFRATLMASVRPFLAQDADTTKLEKALDDLNDPTPIPPGGAKPGEGDAGGKDGVNDALRDLLAGRVPDNIMDQVLALVQNAATEGTLNVPGGDDTPEDLAARLKNCGLTDDQIALCVGALAPPGLDSGEGSGPHTTETRGREDEAVGEEREAIKKRMKDAGMTDEQISSALGLPKKDGERPAMDKGITQQAMDAAISQATKRAEKATIQRINALHTAREAVKPFVGEVHGMDSAAGVYSFALKEAGYDVRGMDENMLGQLWKNHAKMQEASKAPAPRIAQDSGETAKFREDLGLSRIKVSA